jgi:hypothetical protein
MKPAFETAITVLGFGWNSINNEAAWNLPGMRWSKEHAVKYCATTGSMVIKDIYCSLQPRTDPPPVLAYPCMSENRSLSTIPDGL